jgi:sulfate adenylyltransferase subunit 2
MKDFYPAKPLSRPLLHIDTTLKFREMIEFRDATAKRLGLDLIVYVNEAGAKRGINPSLHTQVTKTEELDKYGFERSSPPPPPTRSRSS